MQRKPYIIGISGESGVGKSTIAEIISLFFGEENTIVISTDDLHRWERNNQAWNGITHLNPSANNLELGDWHLRDLVEGKAIYRSIYNHKSGWFNAPKKMESKPIVIIEGLHAFYTSFSQSLVDLKIFVDAHRDIITHWKLLRDTEQRGYKYNDVLEIIKKRATDNGHLRDIQIKVADIIVRIDSLSEIQNLGDKHECIEIFTTTRQITNKLIPEGLLVFIQNFLSDFNDFTRTSEILGRNIETCQNGGGNISVKTDNVMIIKASGYNMKDVNCLSGYSVIQPSEKAKILSSQNDVELDLALKGINVRYKTPSMETAMHLLLKKYVIHVHSIYPTLLLCLSESKRIITMLFSHLDYVYIDYHCPGYALFDAIRNSDCSCKVYFLENHGIVVSSDDLDEANKLLSEINEIAKSYIQKFYGFEEFDLSFAERDSGPKYAFPDAVVFYDNPAKKETIAAHNYINLMGIKLGLVRILDDIQTRTILSLESEKHRKSL